jgi:ATP-binding cassette subfamily C protein CydCD
VSTVAAPRGPLDPRLLRHARSARGGVALAALVGLGTAVATVVQALALATVVARLVGGTGVAGVHTPLVVLAGVVVARGVLGWAAEVVAVRTAAAVQAQLRVAVLAAALQRGPVWLEGRPAGALATLLTSGVRALQEWFGRYLPALVLATVLPAAVVVVIAVHDVESAVIVVATLPLVPVFAVLVGWATRERAQAQWRATGDLTGHFLDAVAGLRTLRTYGRAQRQVRVVADVAERHRRTTVPVLRLAFLSSAALELVGTISVALVAVSAGLRLVAGSLGLQAALTVILLAPEAYRPLREVGARFHASADASTVLGEVEEVLDGAVPVRVGESAGVRLRGVRVLVDGAELLAATDLDAGPAALTVLTGTSGVGKSTLLDVVLGHRRPSSGTVTRPGGPVAVVPQRPGFPGARTVAGALRGGWSQARPEDLVAVLADVGLDGEIELAQPLAEAGGGLSAGQRQRLAVARALLAVRGGARVLVADEPTAHLDPVSEARVVAALLALAHRHDQPCTVLAVAHRPALVAAADGVVRLADPVPGAATVAPRAVTVAPRAVTVAPRAVTVGPRAAQSPPSPATATRVRATAALGLLLGVGAAVAGIGLTATASWLIVRAADRPPVLELSIAVVATRFFGVSRPVLRWLERTTTHSVALGSVARLRASVYAALVPRVPGPAVPRSGSVLTGLVDDVDALADRGVRAVQPLAVAAVVAVLAAAAAALVLPAAAGVLVAGLLVAGVLAPALTVRATRRADRAGAAATAALAEELVEVLRSPRDVTEPAPLLARAARAAERVRTSQTSRAGALGVGAGLGAAALAALPLAVVAVAAPALATGRIGPTLLAVLVLTPLALGEVLAEVPVAVAALLRAAAARLRLDALRSSPPPATEPAVPVPAPATGQPVTVLVEGLDAGWGERPAVRGLDLELAEGERVAVLGASGSGKSTLAAVLLRLLDPLAGSVRLGGTDTRELDGDTVRRHVGWVSDDDHVFAASLRANLALARPGATDDELARALDRAGLGSWVGRLEVTLGDGALTLSGGERRRLALARALLAGAPVLVLDEPTEGLDPPTARRVLADVLDAADGRTVLLLAHRDEGLDRVDRVLELVDGRLVGTRTPV